MKRVGRGREGFDDRTRLGPRRVLGSTAQRDIAQQRLRKNRERLSGRAPSTATQVIDTSDQLWKEAVKNLSPEDQSTICVSQAFICATSEGAVNYDPLYIYIFERGLTSMNTRPLSQNQRFQVSFSPALRGQ